MKQGKSVAHWLAAATLAAGFTGMAQQASAATTSPWCSAGKPVKFAGIDWESGAFVTEVMRYVMEKGYGCQTDALPGNSVTMEAALGNNDIQVFGEEWVGRSDAWNNAFKAGKVKAVGNVFRGAVEGWFVPDYVVLGDPKKDIKPLAPGLKTVADLPKYKNLFRDEEEPSKGRFLNCPSGWTCEGVNTQKLKTYKLMADYVNFRPGTGAALDASIASAVKRRQPVLFYYWTPTAMMGKYKFVQLKEPAYNEACYKTLEDTKNPNPCPSASPEATVQAGVSSVFHKADPVLVSMLSKFNIPLPLLNSTLADMVEKKAEPKAMAVPFLKAHPEIWKQWVPADVATKISASLK